MDWWQTLMKIYHATVPGTSCTLDQRTWSDYFYYNSTECVQSSPSINPLMGWESSSDTYTELRLEFSSKELAINYAKKNKIDYELIEPKKRKTVKKSYADNFLR